MLRMWHNSPMSKSHPNQERGVVWWARNVGRYRVAEMNAYAKRDHSFWQKVWEGPENKDNRTSSLIFGIAKLLYIPSARLIWCGTCFLVGLWAERPQPEPELELPGSDQEFNKFFVGVREFLTGVWAECGRSAQRPTKNSPGPTKNSANSWSEPKDLRPNPPRAALDTSLGRMHLTQSSSKYRRGQTKNGFNSWSDPVTSLPGSGPNAHSQPRARPRIPVVRPSIQAIFAVSCDEGVPTTMNRRKVGRVFLRPNVQS